MSRALDVVTAVGVILRCPHRGVVSGGDRVFC